MNCYQHLSGVNQYRNGYRWERNRLARYEARFKGPQGYATVNEGRFRFGRGGWVA